MTFSEELLVGLAPRSESQYVSALNFAQLCAGDAIDVVGSWTLRIWRAHSLRTFHSPARAIVPNDHDETRTPPAHQWSGTKRLRIREPS